MPPVEVTSSLASPTVPSSRELKVVDMAMQLPVVSDAVSEVSKYAHNISENNSVKHVRQMVEDCLKDISENERMTSVKDSVLPLTSMHLSAVKDTVLPHLTAVRDTVMPHVVEAVETLDNMACNGIDHLKTAVPSLSSPTPELMESAREAASGYLSMLAEYLASFSLVQLSLKIADQSLALVENAAAHILSEPKSCTFIRSVRRSVRAVRRAGARRNQLLMDKLGRSGFLGRVASTLHLNSVLGLLGLELVPVTATPIKTALHKSERRNTDKEPEDLPESRVEELHADLSAYRSEEDPDFVRNSSSSSSSDSEEDSTDDEGVKKTSSCGSSSDSSSETEDEFETPEIMTAQGLKED